MVTITYHEDLGYYEELIEYNYGNEVKNLIRYYTQRDMLLPYEQMWSPYKQLGHDNTLLNTVYTEITNDIEERVYCDTDYVVMGKIGKVNWTKALWGRLVAVR